MVDLKFTGHSLVVFFISQLIRHTKRKKNVIKKLQLKKKIKNILKKMKKKNERNEKDLKKKKLNIKKKLKQKIIENKQISLFTFRINLSRVLDP